ncbi:radical SAM protein [Leptospira perolatii]|uniref:Radical SAM protein n=1 Tax=Leptospira perolatii TaxID=2023191 RepID=A0A2M9ZQL5_9LEPT|nr:arsenosugar biosynthesis radical SAM (seleno)protein ArsS [Leptospira perolatii]PJZ68310.1 radical SAM protein [Leptospira perolatii]PJZ74223.1 radical SAM protein [Leptospira perolatii]
MKSLLNRGSILSDAKEQIHILSDLSSKKGFPLFQDIIRKNGGEELLRIPNGVEILQVNLGKQCNQTCKHCHVDAGPDRKEVMDQKTMEDCLIALGDSNIKILDITGGAPEMNPNFRWFVERAGALGKKIMVRCNLTILLAGEKYKDLPEFFAKNRVEVVSSLPFFQKRRTDAQRGEGVFDKSTVALKKLNAVGYGQSGSGLILNLVYNPGGAFLPGEQSSLESQFKKELFSAHGITFNSLFTITNMPISRFLEYLLESGNLEEYMERLVSSFNLGAVKGLMCRNTLSVGWDGALYDCDFNQMLDLQIEGAPSRIEEFTPDSFKSKSIRLGQHCFGCTAGSGSSCGGALA